MFSDYADFLPHAYLDEYYVTIAPENAALIAFLIDSCATLPIGAQVLEFGSGPTVFSALAAARRAGEIHLSDYAAANRAAIERWRDDAPEAFDWSSYTRLMLSCEGIRVTDERVRDREALTRRTITRVLACDAHAEPPIDGGERLYDAVITNLCLEAAARDLNEWRTILARVVRLIRPGGRLILCAVRGGTAYPIGDRLFHVLPLHERQMRRGLSDAGCDSVQISIAPADHPEYPYHGLMFVTARRAAA